MSKEIGFIDTRGTRALSVAKFDGGNIRGECIQLSQFIGGRIEHVQLDVEGAELLATRLQEFVQKHENY